MARKPRRSGMKGRAAGVRGHGERGAGKRTPSSTRWLQRQLSDPFVAEAHRLGYRSRAAFKLMAIDDKHGLLKPGRRVVDLGAAPGGWSQVAAQRVRAGEGSGAVVAVDLQPIDPIAGVTVMQGDFLQPGAAEAVRALLPGGCADVVLSDMAAPATGHRPTDHLRVMALAEAALDFAQTVLTPGGAFLAKLLQGGSEHDLVRRLKATFTSVKYVKPAASRSESAELYVLAIGFRGRTGRERAR